MVKGVSKTAKKSSASKVENFNQEKNKIQFRKQKIQEMDYELR